MIIVGVLTLLSIAGVGVWLMVRGWRMMRGKP
jgi:hypothetical protein